MTRLAYTESRDRKGERSMGCDDAKASGERWCGLRHTAAAFLSATFSAFQRSIRDHDCLQFWARTFLLPEFEYDNDGYGDVLNAEDDIVGHLTVDSVELLSNYNAPYQLFVICRSQNAIAYDALDLDEDNPDEPVYWVDLIAQVKEAVLERRGWIGFVYEDELEDMGDVVWKEIVLA